MEVKQLLHEIGYRLEYLTNRSKALLHCLLILHITIQKCLLSIEAFQVVRVNELSFRSIFFFTLPKWFMAASAMPIGMYCRVHPYFSYKVRFENKFLMSSSSSANVKMHFPQNMHLLSLPLLPRMPQLFIMTSVVTIN